MQKRTQLYEGKAKKVYESDNPELYIVSYKDDATAFNGENDDADAGFCAGVVPKRTQK